LANGVVFVVVVEDEDDDLERDRLCVA